MATPKKSKASSAKGTDDVVLQLMGEISKRKAAIKAAERTAWRTNCMFAFSGDSKSSSVINLNVVADAGQLLQMAAALSTQYAAYNRVIATAGQELGVEVETPPTFKWCGYTYEDWMKDIGSRLAKLQIASARQKLAALETRLNGIISPELRAKMELEAIQAELGA